MMFVGCPSKMYFYLQAEHKFSGFHSGLLDELFTQSLFFTFWFRVGQLSSHSGLKGSRIARNWVKDWSKCEIEWRKSFVYLVRLWTVEEGVIVYKIKEKEKVDAKGRLFFFRKAITPSCAFLVQISHTAFKRVWYITTVWQKLMECSARVESNCFLNEFCSQSKMSKVCSPLFERNRKMDFPLVYTPRSTFRRSDCKTGISFEFLRIQMCQSYRFFFDTPSKL